MVTVSEILQHFRRRASGQGVRTLFFGVTAVQAGAVWLHRCFPSQDGAVQLYYTDVLADLLRDGGSYSAYFRLNSHAPVYCFFNYALLLLNQMFSPLTSERILVSLYVVAFSLGARFLVHSVEPRNDWLPFFLLPFAFNSYLYLGIYNYSFGIATLFFAMGVWLRAMPGWSGRAWLLWLALVMALCTMHQLALAFLGLFIAGHLAAIFVGAYRAAGGCVWGRMRPAGGESRAVSPWPHRWRWPCSGWRALRLQRSESPPVRGMSMLRSGYGRCCIWQPCRRFPIRYIVVACCC